MMEAKIWLSWMCVPGPAQYCVVEARRTPGAAVTGSGTSAVAICLVGLGERGGFRGVEIVAGVVYAMM